MFIKGCIPRTSGVYIIKCLINEKIYIGSCKNLNYKIEKFYKAQSCPRPPELHEDYLRYGEKNFEFGVLCTCNYRIANIIESYFIKHYNSIEKGYNSINASVVAKQSETFISSKFNFESCVNRVLDDLFLNIFDVNNLDKKEIVELEELIYICKLDEIYDEESSLRIIFDIIDKLDLYAYVKSHRFDGYYKVKGNKYGHIFNDPELFPLTFCEGLPREIIHSDLITSDVYLEVPKINNKYLCGEYKIIPIDTVEFEKKNKVVK